MSFKKKKKTKNDVETIRIKAGDLSLESWQYYDGVMFEVYILDKRRDAFVIGRKDADKLAKWLLNGERNK